MKMKRGAVRVQK